MRTAKFIIMIGLPGAGKSTFAKNIYLGDPLGTVRISMDDLIYMFTFYDYKEEINWFYRELEKDLILKSLTKGFNVILDRTNIDRKTRAFYIDIGKKIRDYAHYLLNLVELKIGLFEQCSERDILGILKKAIEFEIKSQKIDESMGRSFIESIHNILKGHSIFSAPETPLKILDVLKSVKNLKILGLYFDVPPEICLMRRLASYDDLWRETVRKIDWKSVIEKMHGRLEIPELSEGFDEIHFIGEKGEVEKIDSSFNNR